MSTFFGGEQLIEVKTLEDVVSPSGVTIYTVPAGRYAVLNKIFMSIGDGIDIVYNYDALATSQLITSTNVLSSGVLLNEGDQLRTTNSLSYYLFIREYKKP